MIFRVKKLMRIKINKNNKQIRILIKIQKPIVFVKELYKEK